MSLIALLVSILVPSLKRTRQMASSAVCTHNLRQIGYALSMYRMDHHGWLPPVRVPQVKQAPSSVASSDVWFVKLIPGYLDDLNLLGCPEDPFRFRLEQARRRGSGPSELADCVSYGLNSFIMEAYDGALAQIDRFRIRAEATILVGDLGPDSAGHRSSDGTLGPDRDSLLPISDGFSMVDDPRDSWLTTRHGDGINVLTLLGGVQRARTVEVLKNELRAYYFGCAVGGCTLCNEFELLHYSFAKDHLYWWIGPAPEP